MEWPQPLEQYTSQSSKQSSKLRYRVVTDEVERAIIIVLSESKKGIKREDLVKKVIKMTKTYDVKVYRKIRKLADMGVIQLSTDLKDTYVYLNKDKVKISRNYMLYLHFYFLVTLGLIISGILSYIMLMPSIMFGAVIVSALILLKCVIDLFTRKDLLIVKIRID